MCKHWEHCLLPTLLLLLLLLLLDLVKPPLRKWPGGCPPPPHPQKPLRLPCNPTALPCSLPSSFSSRCEGWWGQGEPEEQMSAQSDHLEPVSPPHTCCLKAPSLPQTSLHPFSHFSLSTPPTPLTPFSTQISPLPLCPEERCGGGGLRQVDCRGAIPSPHGRRTLTVACRPPASVPPLPLVQLARVASWSNHPHWQQPDDPAADGGNCFLVAL